MIDMLTTIKKQNIIKSGVIDLGQSDHSLIFGIKKHCTLSTRPKVSYARNFKNYIANDLLYDHSQMA